VPQAPRFGLGPVDLNVISASAQHVQRTPDMAARRGSPDYELVLVRGGRCELRHCGRTVLVPEGGFVLLDNQRAYALRFDVDSDCFAVHLPDPWLPRPRDFAAQELPGERPWGRALAALLSAGDLRRLCCHAAPLPISWDRCSPCWPGHLRRLPVASRPSWHA
jgi:hypothetical protein